MGTATPTVFGYVTMIQPWYCIILRDDGINSHFSTHPRRQHPHAENRRAQVDMSITPSWLEEFVLKMRMDQARTLLKGAG
jgi:hypothetical protein